MAEEFDRVLEVAKYQHGYVATYQVGVSPKLLHYHEQAGALERVHHGIYRAKMYPREENEEFVVAFLWSRERGTISHASALAAHGISDALPTKVHITLPTDEQPLRRKVPDWLAVHFGDVLEEEREWYDVVPLTRPVRTLVDVAVEGLDLAQLRQSVDDVRRLGLADNVEWTLIDELRKRCQG